MSKRINNWHIDLIIPKGDLKMIKAKINRDLKKMSKVSRKVYWVHLWDLIDSETKWDIKVSKIIKICKLIVHNKRIIQSKHNQ